MAYLLPNNQYKQTNYQFTFSNCNKTFINRILTRFSDLRSLKTKFTSLRALWCWRKNSNGINWNEYFYSWKTNLNQVMIKSTIINSIYEVLTIQTWAKIQYKCFDSCEPLYSTMDEQKISLDLELQIDEHLKILVFFASSDISTNLEKLV